MDLNLEIGRVFLIKKFYQTIHQGRQTHSCQQPTCVYFSLALVVRPDGGPGLGEVPALGVHIRMMLIQIFLLSG